MDPVTLLVVAIICLAIGFLGGILVNTLRGDRQQAPEPPKDAAPSTDPQLAGYKEVARFMRMGENGPLLVMMDGKLAGSAIEIEAEERNRLEDLVLEMRTWMGFQPYPAQDPFGSSVAGAQAPEPAVVQASAAFGSAAIPAGPVLATPPFAAPKSIVGQIDEILQDHLFGTPLADKRIRLVEKPNQGVVVMIGLEQFPSIEDVPDPEIRNLIRQAVSEWELRAK